MNNHYAIEYECDSRWATMSTWSVPPGMFREFLDHLNNLLQYGDDQRTYDWDDVLHHIRVRRIPHQGEQATWEYFGGGHSRTQV